MNMDQAETGLTLLGSTGRGIALDAARSRIRIKAIKRIKPGDEITDNYGKNDFDTFIKAIGCKCLSCRTVRPECMKASAVRRSVPFALLRADILAVRPHASLAEQT
jgi:hypothetical protein